MTQHNITKVQDYKGKYQNQQILNLKRSEEKN